MTHDHATEQALVPTLTPKEKMAQRFERRAPGSNFSAMCERLEERRASVGGECQSCDGLGCRFLSPAEMAYWKARIERETGHTERQREKDAMTRASRCDECKGTGYLSQRPDDESARMDSMTTTVTCASCRGRDARKNPAFMESWAGSSCGEVRTPTDVSAETGDVCPRCRGAAYVVPITARPSLKTQDERKTWSGDDDGDPGFELFLVMHPEAEAKAKPEDALAEEDALILEALYGAHGDTWAQHEFGRRFALWPLTAAGRELAAESLFESAKEDRYERLLDLLAREREALKAREPGRPARGALVTQADGQARTLERRASEALRAIEAA